MSFFQSSGRKLPKKSFCFVLFFIWKSGIHFVIAINQFHHLILEQRAFTKCLHLILIQATSFTPPRIDLYAVPLLKCSSGTLSGTAFLGVPLKRNSSYIVSRPFVMFLYSIWTGLFCSSQKFLVSNLDWPEKLLEFRRHQFTNILKVLELF